MSVPENYAWKPYPNGVWHVLSSANAGKNSYPMSVEFSDNIISRSWNNFKGQFQDKLVNTKMKIKWNWDFLDDAALDDIYGGIEAAIEANKSRTFYVRSYIPGRGYKEFIAYLGTPVTIKSKGTKSDGKPVGWSLSLDWIEVDGTVLLDE